MTGFDRTKAPLLILALAAGASVASAAKRAGISEATARRRLRDEDFRRQVDQARAEMLAQAVARLTSSSVLAVDTLRDLLSSPLDFARLGAARAILDVGLRYREQHDLAERVSALEQRLAQGDEPWKPRAV